ncbi:GDSL-type esterase/lipase family protein [Gammaproteobacteria bacterium]|nr:GDSL-type esterase/lipase family protein [Gammaproteobacteria bacterium]
MNKKLLITSVLFILVSCSDGFIKLEERIKSHAIKNNIEMSYFQVKKEALYLYQWSKKNTFIDEINEFKRLDKENFPEKGRILFTGSSSIRFWNSLEKDMQPLKVLNRGFGGAHISHVIHHFDDIVRPYSPKAIVFFCGTNDLTALKTPEETLNDFKKFLKLVKNEFGTIKVYMIGIKPSVDRLYLDEEERVFNNSISFLAKEDPYLEYINVWDLMLNEDGTRMPDLYVEDGLHMNPKGYEIWTQLVRESLNKDFNL